LNKKRPSKKAITVACAVYDLVVGEATCIGWFPSNDPLADPNAIGIRVKAGEFRRIVARAVDAALAAASSEDDKRIEVTLLRERLTEAEKSYLREAGWNKVMKESIGLWFWEKEVNGEILAVRDREDAVRIQMKLEE